MKRYVCTVATGLLLALVSTGSATAGLPLLGNTQQGTQSTNFGDQTVGEQKNDADVNQYQGNGNINVSPTIAFFGDANTSNQQGNGNSAVANVKQANTATQSQSSSQTQSLDQSGSQGRSNGRCCGGQSQTGTQETTFGDQTVGEQKNDADVNQAQGNGNVNISPAVAIGGDASTWNAQGNGNTARADVDQSNTASQSQDSTQSQRLEQDNGRCCGGQSQTGSQETTFGDQTVGEQKNDADVNQYQGNGNINVSPAVAIGGDASTWNAQGNGNTARANVDQSNQATQSQSSTQSQNLRQGGGGCCQQPHRWKPPEDNCGPAPHSELRSHGNSAPCRTHDRPNGNGSIQVGEQSTSFGDQTVGEQKNDADVTQAQGNKNVNISPALGTGSKSGPREPKCGHGKPSGADASTWNAQGNGNTAWADVDQSNTVDQTQEATQTQSLAQGKGVNLS
jgi:hypothetical protein